MQIKNLQDIFKPNITEKQLLEISPIALAFIGDGLHTIYVRDMVIKENILLVKDYHKMSSSFCNANAQAKQFDAIFPILTEQEKEVVRRTRNSKIHHTSKNTDEATYKKATCFEAVLGYLYLLGNYDRINEILNIEE
ncbi:MAG: Mini-ribonuclease 3 [Clostridia bacterium]|nr:Mini-ribonuclease 3 [Clostridia bacterium]